jgi:hypothetical protein
VIFSVTYDDTDPWPTAADGRGHSLVPTGAGNTDLSNPPYWRASQQINGSPGRVDTGTATLFAFGTPQLTAEGIRIQFRAAPQRAWVLEGSADFSTWTPLSTNAGPAVLDFPLPSTPAARYFRAVAR